MDELKAAVDSLAAGGFTNHADAFAKATALFDPNSTNAKVMVMFTDGKTTAGPDPSVQVDCGTVVQPEPCPVPIDVAVSGCRDALEYDLGDVYLESAGRILQLAVNLKNVCPRKRVALAIVLSEVDQQGNEYQRGTKTLTIPAHFSTSCRDVLVKCVKFILPEDLDVSGGSTTAMCNTRNFKARVFAHNIDSDFYCCNNVTFRHATSL